MEEQQPKYLAAIRCHGLGHNNGFYLTSKEPQEAALEILVHMKETNDLNSAKELNKENLRKVIEKATKETARTNTQKGQLFYLEFVCDESKEYTKEQLKKLLGTDVTTLWALTYEIGIFSIANGSDKMREDIKNDLGKFAKESFISKYEIEPRQNGEENIVTKLGL